MELRDLAAWEVAAILVVAAGAGAMTYVVADVEGVSLWINTVLGALFALVAATVSMLLIDVSAWFDDLAEGDAPRRDDE